MSEGARSYETRTIHPEMTVRQIVADFPSACEVFRRHGEPDRSGRFGHFEPLSHFARRQEVPLEQILKELVQVTGVPIDACGPYAGHVHRGFLVTALAITLSLGAGWGTWLLLQISLHSDFAGVPASYIIAHGEAQLWGFIALFVMGVSLRTVLDSVPRHPWGKWFCRCLLALTIAGIAGGFFWFALDERGHTLAVASSAALLLMAGSLWIVQLLVLSRKIFATWVRAVIASGFWLTLWAATTCGLRIHSDIAGSHGYSEAARLLIIELAVFGFAMNSIYGFGEILLPGFLRTGRTRTWAIESTFWLHNLGTAIVSLATGFASAVAMTVGVICLVAGSILCAIGQHAFSGKSRRSQRPEQGHWLLDWYVPLAFFWLVASLLLLAGGSIYEMVAGARLPHAFAGAVRHALTVGFMTPLILGVGQRLLPVVESTVLVMPATDRSDSDPDRNRKCLASGGLSSQFCSPRPGLEILFLADCHVRAAIRKMVYGLQWWGCPCGRRRS